MWDTRPLRKVNLFQYHTVSLSRYVGHKHTKFWKKLNSINFLLRSLKLPSLQFNNKATISPFCSGTVFQHPISFLTSFETLLLLLSIGVFSFYLKQPLILTFFLYPSLFLTTRLQRSCSLPLVFFLSPSLFPLSI